ncbi:MAG: biotin transporter BioY [Spirochaetales bacterium]|nr:biotin transporter BioY [Spirochaetales bacterium]
MNTVKNMMFASLFSALYVAGTIIRIPIPPVPIVLTNIFLVLGGFVLGPLWGSLSVGLYLLFGTLGLPVFSSGGGVAVFMGPSGGYLFGYLLCSITSGLSRNIARGSFKGYLAGTVLGMLSIYLPAIPWLSWVLQTDWIKSLTLGFFPFIAGDILKGFISVAVVRYISANAGRFILNRTWDSPQRNSDIGNSVHSNG